MFILRAQVAMLPLPLISRPGRRVGWQRYTSRAFMLSAQSGQCLAPAALIRVTYPAPIGQEGGWIHSRPRWNGEEKL
jgi:hypothetical protein